MRCKWMIFRVQFLYLMVLGVFVFFLSNHHVSLQATSQTGEMAQEVSDEESPVQIETLEVEPTVVKTGDLIIQTYRVRYPDLLNEGKEIIILEDRMVPETLPVHPFEGVSLEIEKRQVDNEHIWDFVYEFRLIAPEKSMYVLPGFSFYYLVRDLGEDVEDAEVRQVDGGGNLVRYVTTLTDTPVLDIRDTIELGSFSARATFFRALAWTVAPLPLLIWFVMLIRQSRRPKATSEVKQREAEELERLEAQIPVLPSIWQARRNLLQELKALDSLVSSERGELLRTTRRNLIIAGREYLQAELPDLNSGDTSKDMDNYVENLQDGSRKDALRNLSSRLSAYQHSLERDGGSPIDDPSAEAQALQDSVAALRPHNRLLSQIKGVFGA